MGIWRSARCGYGSNHECDRGGYDATTMIESGTCCGFPGIASECGSGSENGSESESGAGNDSDDDESGNENEYNLC